jgi:HTH-type transcriptional regulator, global nitrogen regulator NrpRI
MSFVANEVERKTLSILKVLHNSQKPLGGRVIAQLLKTHGITLTERAVRYHLKLMDERGLTSLVGNQDGRIITEKGLSEIKRALVKDKVGFAISKIESLAFRTNFDFESGLGNVPVNISLFPKSEFEKALRAMKPAFDKGFCVSKLVAVAESGQRIGDIFVPENKIGFVTVCSIAVNGVLLKAGVPMDSRFSGTVQIENHKPTRFTELIAYNGCSLDPTEIFIKARMTSVNEVVATGNGELLANFREIPSICLPVVERVLSGIRATGIGGVLLIGNVSDSVCEVPVDLNKVGLVLTGGLNPVAAAAEAGIEAENHSMSTLIDYKSLTKFQNLLTDK